MSNEKYGGDITCIIMHYLNEMQISAMEDSFVENMLDDLFGIVIADIILDYYRNIYLY